MSIHNFWNCHNSNETAKAKPIWVEKLIYERRIKLTCVCVCMQEFFNKSRDNIDFAMESCSAGECENVCVR